MSSAQSEINITDNKSNINNCLNSFHSCNSSPQEANNILPFMDFYLTKYGILSENGGMLTIDNIDFLTLDLE